MATNFPTSLDSLTNPATTDQLNSPSHAAQHTNANDAIEKLQAKVGVDGSTVTTSHSYKIAQLESDVQNSLGDYIPLSVLGEPDGVAKLDADGNLIVPENKIIIEGATADAHELTLQAPDVASDITVTLPNAAGTLALTSDITTAVNNLVNSAPTTLDTLNELATALGNDANFATTTATSIGNKVSKAGGDTITSSLSSVIPLVLKGAASQTANLQEWQDSAGNLLGRITSTGVTSFYGGSNIFPGDVRAGTQSYFTAALSVASRVATESGLAVRGFASQTADLQQWQNSAGTVLAKVDNNAYFTMGSSTHPGGILGVVAPTASSRPVVIRGATSQTANLLEFQNSGGTAVTFFNASGGLTATEGVISTAYSGGKMTTGTVGYFNATTFNAAVSPIVVRGAASQTADLQQWQNSAGSVLSYIKSDGSLHFTANSNAVLVSGTATSGLNRIISNGNDFLFSPYFDGLFAPANSAGSWRPANDATSDLGSSGQRWKDLYATSGTLTNNSTSKVGLIVKGAASQTANLQEWQGSTGTVAAKVSSNGASSSISGGFFGTASGPIDAGNYLAVRPWAANHIPFTVKGFAAQTGDLTRWLDDAGTVLAKIDSTGAMFTTTAAANTNTTQVATTAYVQTELADLVNSAPATLDTLKELSDALGADANFATTVTNNLALKAPLASPALTGTPTAPTAAVGTDSTQVATTAFVIDQIDASTQPGALYQTTAPTSPEIGQIWIDSDDNVTVFDSNIIRRQPFTATAGQTNFVTTVPFIDGFEQVYFNGLLLLKTTDYTTSGTNTVILGSAAAVNDIIEVVTITNLNSVNTYTQAETDALLAANTSVAPLSISANTNILAKKRYFVTSASALTLTLPASPALNDEIQILDASGNASTYNITVARNGRLINGNAGNLIIDNNGGWYTLVYTGATYGWKVG